MADYKIIEATPEQWREAYVAKVGHGEDIILAGDEAKGFYFTTADGVYETAPDVVVPDYILDQPWSFTIADVDAKGEDAAAEYYKIGERLYEIP